MGGVDLGSNASSSKPDPGACEHIQRLLHDDARLADADRRYTEVVRWGAVAEGAKRRKTAAPQCAACRKTLVRPWACLTCAHTSCFDLAGQATCMRSHWSSSTCSFAVDSHTGTLFCSACDDAVYSDHYERLLDLARLRVEEAADVSREEKGALGGRGKGRGAYREWEDGDVDRRVAKGEVVRVPCGGLRPLLNLSQTCFLSAILQALIANPLLRAYFLSDKHNRHVCSNGSRGLQIGKPLVGDGAAAERDKGCMCCEMDRAFEEFYSQDKSPFGPITMLYAMWHASAELEGYGQQDAHSFFLAALDQIHAHAKGQLSSCNCIAHQTFAGALQSTVTCSSCSHPSTTIDPILDVQLDFPPQLAVASSASSQSSVTSVEGGGEALTLAGLLRRFCAEERVGETGGQGYACTNCGGGQGVTAARQLSIRKLPPVLSFQLKRFAHNATSSKIEAHVRFPSRLDMRPFVSDAAAETGASAATGAGGSGSGRGRGPGTGARLPDSVYAYDLFAVVTHEGKLDNGHYWADVRDGDEWWHCDDDKVTPTSLGAVLAQKAYMLFYVKRTLAYAEPPPRPFAPAAQANGTGTGAGGVKQENGH
ncbi:hypothetical protein Q5752_004348 [Cryptotrichosporon argae]